MKGIWKLRAEENRIAGWWMFLFIVHLFLMLAVPLGLSGVFLVEKYFGSREELTEPTKLAGNSESAMQPSWWPARWHGKNQNCPCSCPTPWLWSCLQMYLHVVWRIRLGGCSKGSLASFFLVAELHDVCCGGAPGVSDQEVQSSYCFWGAVLGVNMINSKYFSVLLICPIGVSLCVKDSFSCAEVTCLKI